MEHAKRGVGSEAGIGGVAQERWPPVAGDCDVSNQAALAHVAELLDLKTGWVWLLEEETGQPYLAGALNLPPGLVKNPRLMEGSCYCLDTYHAGDLNGAAGLTHLSASCRECLLFRTRLPDQLSML